jgi:hypothetical protein
LNSYEIQRKIIDNNQNISIKNIPPGYMLFESINPIIGFLELDKEVLKDLIINKI